MTDTSAVRTALASLDSLVAGALADLDTSATQLSALNSQVSSLATANSALLVANTSLTQQNAVLKAKVAELTPLPHFPIGASVPNTALGTLPIQRTYGSKGITIGTAPTTPVVHSFKSYVAADVAAWVKAAPAGSFIAFHHEPEDDIEAKTLTPATWVANTIALCNAIVANGRVGQVRPAAIFMRWSLSPAANRDALMKSLMTPEVVSALKSANGVAAFDAYAHDYANGAPADDPDVEYGVAARYAASLGLAWGIGETSTDKSKATNGAATAAWWKSVFDYVQTNPPAFFMGWNSTTQNAGVYAFHTVPEVADVWKNAMATYK